MGDDPPEAHVEQGVRLIAYEHAEVTHVRLKVAARHVVKQTPGSGYKDVWCPRVNL